MEEKYTLEYIKNNNLILLEAISGSHAYGTNNENSDIDYRGVYICEHDDLLTGSYPEQINDEGNDITFYEIGRYMELLIRNNPNILELLAVPEDCVVSKHNLFNLIKQEDFVSKMCEKTLGGYASEQIKKARGLNKKINNPVEVIRKSPMDFCHIVDGYNSIPLRKWLEDNQFEQLFCGITSIPHARDMYALFYDETAHNCFSESIPEQDRELLKMNLKQQGESLGFGYNGVVKGKSDTIRLSSIPSGQKAIAIFHYNKDGYTVHCKAYREYFDWVNKRNVHRYNIAKENDFDPKNMLHCYRLSEMSVEIAEGKGIIVRRPNRDFLMKIRNGNIEYDDILSASEELMKKSKEIFATSPLREEPDMKKAKEILLKIRKSFYNFK